MIEFWGYWTNPPRRDRIAMAHSLPVGRVPGWVPTMSALIAHPRSPGTHMSVLKGLRVPNLPREGRGVGGATPGSRAELRQSQRAPGVCDGQDPVLGMTPFLRATSLGVTSPRATNHLMTMERVRRRSIGTMHNEWDALGYGESKYKVGHASICSPPVQLWIPGVPPNLK